MTMREKLIEAARAKLEANMPVVDAGLCAAMVDAILTTLREPDDGMLSVGAERLWRDDLVRPDGMFTAMIDHIRSGK